MGSEYSFRVWLVLVMRALGLLVGVGIRSGSRDIHNHMNLISLLVYC